MNSRPPRAQARPRRLGADHGMGLLLVLIVLAALVMVAIPFAISMVMHERASKTAMETTRARFAAQGARNRAADSLAQTLQAKEEAEKDASASAGPRADTLEDLSPAVPGGDPRGILQGLRAEDEQGKIHLATAPDNVLDTLATLCDPATTRWGEFLTRYSWRPNAWNHPLVARLRGNKSVDVDEPQWFGPRSRVRFCDARGQFITTVDKDDDPNDATINVDDPIPGGLGEPCLLIEVEQRHPINLNTASRETLQSLFTGVALKGKSDQAITATEAKNLAAFLVQQTLDEESFPTLMKEAAASGILTPQKAGTLMLNGWCPTHAQLDGSGTMPYCFRAYDAFTLDQSGLVHNPAGNVWAAVEPREVATVAWPGPRTLALQSQGDFQRHLNTFGHLVWTLPEAVFGGVPPSYETGPLVGQVMIQSQEDHRGNSMLLQEHFKGKHYGMDVAGSFSQGLGSKTIPQPKPKAGGPFDIPAGGIEFWMRPGGGNGKRVLLEAKSKDVENRLRLWTEGGELLLGVWDGTVEKEAAVVRYQTGFASGRWYHIGAYWKGSQYAQLALAVDGLPVGNFGLVDPFKTKGKGQVAKLTSALGAGATSLTVDNGGAFPAQGVLEIGGECIEYTTHSGNNFSNLARAARGTAAAAHPANVAVATFGYSNELAQNVTITLGGAGGPAMTVPLVVTGIPKVGATLESGFGQNPQAILAVKAVTSDTTIKVDTTDEYPDVGVIRIGMEVVTYDAKTPTEFQNCQRGAMGSTAADHLKDASVHFEGFCTSNITNYPQYCLVQLDEEWFIVRCYEDPNLNRTFMCRPFPGIPWRQAVATTRMAHADGVKVLPVFATKEIECGPEDKVTLVEASQQGKKEQMTVHIARPQPGVAAIFFGPAQMNVGLAAFDDFTKKGYGADGINRLLKFPSGELPSELPGTMTLADGVCGTIDELRFFSGPKGPFLLSAPITPSAGTVDVNVATGLNAGGGIVKIGDEWIGYPEGPNGNQMGNCTRGFLKSTAVDHDAGERIFNLAFLGATGLTSGIDATGATAIPVKSTAGFQAANSTSTGTVSSPTTMGYALIGNEIVGYIRADATNFILTPTLGGASMFRGAFGTSPATHNRYEMAYALPWRFYDGYAAAGYDNQMVYYQATVRATDAIWKRVTWDESLTPDTRIHVLIRLDGGPEWMTPGSNKAGGLWDLTTSKGKNALTVRADQAEVRVLFEYVDGAYANGTWKDTPTLDNLFLEYEQNNQVRYHGEDP